MVTTWRGMSGAWRQAELALPPGWKILSLSVFQSTWTAQAVPQGGATSLQVYTTGVGPDPVAALLDLAHGLTRRATP